MPIVQVSALPAEPEVVERMLGGLVTGLAEALGCPPGDVWASFAPVAAQHVGPRVADRAGQCPVVVIRGRARDQARVSAALAAAARVVGAELGVLVEDVWLQWVDVVPQRAFAGGAPVA